MATSMAALKMLDFVPANPRDVRRVSLEKLGIYSKKGDLPQAEALLKKLIDGKPEGAGVPQRADPTLYFGKALR